MGTLFAPQSSMEPRRNVGRFGRHRTAPRSPSEAPEPAGLADFRGALSLAEDHLVGPRGHVMPALSLSEAVDDVVCFRFTRDRRRYLAHVLPYREQRAGYPRFDRNSFRSARPAPSAPRPQFG